MWAVIVLIGLLALAGFARCAGDSFQPGILASEGPRSHLRDSWSEGHLRSLREERRNSPHKPLPLDQQEKEPHPHARREGRPPVPGKNRHKSGEHSPRRILGEEQIPELRRVERDHKATERKVALPLAPGETSEP